MEERKILVTTCSCGEPIYVPIKKIGALMVSLRKHKNTAEFMKMIAKKPRKKNRR